jgi:hypothetical protein
MKITAPINALGKPLALPKPENMHISLTVEEACYDDPDEHATTLCSTSHTAAAAFVYTSSLRKAALKLLGDIVPLNEHMTHWEITLVVCDLSADCLDPSWTASATTENSAEIHNCVVVLATALTNLKAG